MGQTTATVDGAPATLDDLVPLAFAGYGHYTSMQVRGGRVRGLGLHLDRLREASRELFGAAVADERIRAYLRAAVGTGDASVRVHVFSRDGGAVLAGRPVEPSVLIRTEPPAEPSTTAVRVRTARFGRPLPHLKNVATLGALHQWRQARVAGHDDVLFVGDDGAVAEGSIWNVAFFDGSATVWPSAPMLPGITMRLVRAGLDTPSVTRPVTVGELAGMRGAALLNSIHPARPIAAIDGAELPVDPQWLARLHAAHAGHEPETP